jgi:SAM-dependent methyltransferase
MKPPGMSSKFDEEYYLAANPDVAMAVLLGLCANGREHYQRYGRSEGRPMCEEDERKRGVPTKSHRREAAHALSGRGIEIGAFDSPCPVGAECQVTYCDVWALDEARRQLPEVQKLDLVEPSVLLDLDLGGLEPFAAGSQDFAIANHVIEHVANPIRCMQELFRVLRPGGHLVLSVPDQRYTVDRARAVTGWEHLLSEYEAKVTEVDLFHFMDIVAFTRPDIVSQGVDAIVGQLRLLKARREHAHVWNSDTFREFVVRNGALFGKTLETVFEAVADETLFEYFAIVRVD